MSYSLSKYFNNAAKPAACVSGTSLSDVSQPVIQAINNVAPKFQRNRLKKEQMLLDDVSILQKKQSATKPSNEVRDAMIKLDTFFQSGRRRRVKYILPIKNATL